MTITSEKIMQYPEDLPEGISYKRNQHNNNSLRRMFLACSYCGEDLLKKNGFEPNELRSIFCELYQIHKPQEFSPEEYFCTNEVANKCKEILNKYFDGEIPTGYIMRKDSISKKTGPFMILKSTKLQVLFSCETATKIKFIKATISYNEDCDIYEKTLIYDDCIFEEISTRDAFEKTPGLGMNIINFSYSKLLNSFN
jgi:hypothetical protein